MTQDASDRLIPHETPKALSPLPPHSTRSRAGRPSPRLPSYGPTRPDVSFLTIAGIAVSARFYTWIHTSRCDVLSLTMRYLSLSTSHPSLTTPIDTTPLVILGHIARRFSTNLDDQHRATHWPHINADHDPRPTSSIPHHAPHI
ncbi:hypothetical protein FB45DRAFT_881254 [Roridomyces roridus]|uniref:Uncharacterized protein n=1 Tax=Roridomyces roridus TaxID=1738132 RepID=A0AAD7AYE4_9AGAR|nr:hypothetical protein FB45DRAFT_881254 [Roridomyces roridus]